MTLAAVERMGYERAERDIAAALLSVGTGTHEGMDKIVAAGVSQHWARVFADAIKRGDHRPKEPKRDE